MRTWVGAASGCLFVVGLVSACSSKTHLPPQLDNEGAATPVPGGGPGAGSGDAAADGNDKDAACAAITNDSSIVNESYVGEAAPLPIGGSIASGTYFLTGAFVYTGTSGSSGPTGRTLQETLAINVASFADADGIGTSEGGGVAASFADGTFTATGSQLTFAASCPVAGSSTVAYSVIGNTLHILQGQTERVLTLQ